MVMVYRTHCRAGLNQLGPPRRVPTISGIPPNTRRKAKTAKWLASLSEEIRAKVQTRRDLKNVLRQGKGGTKKKVTLADHA